MIITAWPAGRLRLVLSQSATIASAAWARVSWMWRRSWAWYWASAGPGSPFRTCSQARRSHSWLARWTSVSSALGTRSDSCCEEPAGADRAQLRGVAGEHELAVGLGGDLGEPGQALGVGHPGLVHDHDGPWAKVDAVVLDAVAETVGGEGAIEARVVSQPLRGGAGDGGADHLIALELPGPGRGGDDDALAGAGAADELRDAAGAGDRLQRLALLLGERAVDLRADLAARLLEGRLAERGGVLVGAPLGDLDRGLLQLAQAAGRPHAVLEADQLAAARQLLDQPVGLGGPADSGAQLVGLGAQLAVVDHRALPGDLARAALRGGRRRLGWISSARSNSASERSALSPCSSPTALHASLTSSRSAALLEPRVLVVSEPSSPARGSRP